MFTSDSPSLRRAADVLADELARLPIWRARLLETVPAGAPVAGWTGRAADACQRTLDTLVVAGRALDDEVDVVAMALRADQRMLRDAADAADVAWPVLP